MVYSWMARIQASCYSCGVMMIICTWFSNLPTFRLIRFSLQIIVQQRKLARSYSNQWCYMDERQWSQVLLQWIFDVCFKSNTFLLVIHWPLGRLWTMGANIIFQMVITSINILIYMLIHLFPVQYHEVDLPPSFPMELRQYIPNIYYSGHDPTTQNTRVVALISTREIKDNEELFSTYMESI